jgi:hypothetical protein
MTDADGAGQSVAALQPIPQDAKPALGLHSVQCAVVVHADTGGVITAILKLFQTI